MMVWEFSIGPVVVEVWGFSKTYFFLDVLCIALGFCLAVVILDFKYGYLNKRKGLYKK